jgi:hypothetical protein
MIPSSAAWVEAYWEPLLVLRLEQRRVAGRERPSEQRLEVQPGFLEESQVHLHPHPAPISATQPMDIPVTVIQATDIRATRSPAMAIRATRETPLTSLLRAMDTQPTQDSPPTPPRVTDRQATRGTPTPDPRPLRRQVTEIPSLAIPAIALRRTGHLGSSTRSSLLAEFWVRHRSSRHRVRLAVEGSLNEFRGALHDINSRAGRGL